MLFPWRCFYQRKHKKTRKQPQKLPDHKSDHERPWLTKALKCCWMLTSALFLIFPRLRQLLASSGLFWTFWPNFCCFRPFYATSNLFWPFWPILVSPPHLFSPAWATFGLFFKKNCYFGPLLALFFLPLWAPFWPIWSVLDSSSPACSWHILTWAVISDPWLWLWTG